MQIGSQTITHTDLCSDETELLIYLLANRKKVFPASLLCQKVWPEEAITDGSKVRSKIHRLRTKLPRLQNQWLIETTDHGYRINPNLPIQMDIESFDRLHYSCRTAAENNASETLIRKLLSIYRGKIAEDRSSLPWLENMTTRYHSDYILDINQLLQNIYKEKQYRLVYESAIRSLKVAPENPEGYYWIIKAFTAMGLYSLAKSELQSARHLLLYEEYHDLCLRIQEEELTTQVPSLKNFCS